MFAIGGALVLSLLHISLQRSRRRRPATVPPSAVPDFLEPRPVILNESEKRDAEQPGDIAVFPLAFPLIAGPGGLLAAVLVMGQTLLILAVGSGKSGWGFDARCSINANRHPGTGARDKGKEAALMSTMRNPSLKPLRGIAATLPSFARFNLQLLKVDRLVTGEDKKIAALDEQRPFRSVLAII